MFFLVEIEVDNNSNWAGCVNLLGPPCWGGKPSSVPFPLRLDSDSDGEPNIYNERQGPNLAYFTMNNTNLLFIQVKFQFWLGNNTKDMLKIASKFCAKSKDSLHLLLVDQKPSCLPWIGPSLATFLTQSALEWL